MTRTCQGSPHMCIHRRRHERVFTEGEEPKHKHSRKQSSGKMQKTETAAIARGINNGKDHTLRSLFYSMIVLVELTVLKM